MSPIVFRSVIVLFAAVAAAVHLATAVHARFVHPLDEWLAGNPKVAEALIWEFPPAVPYKKPFVSRNTRWTRYTVIPYPSTYPATSLAIFSREILEALVDRHRFSLRMLNEGLDPGRIESTLPSHPKFTKVPPKVTLPGFNLDFVPSGEQVSDQGGDITAWPQWHEVFKQALRDRYDAYLPLVTEACSLYAEYAASDFTVKPAGFDAAFSTITDTDPLPVLDPPVNIQPDDVNVPGAPWTMLSSDDAFALFTRLVAQQLAMEMGGCLPWSLNDYDAAELMLLFDGRTSFRYAAAGPSSWGTMTATGHVSVGNVIPAPPMIVLGFLGQEKIIAADRLETVLRFLTWQRERLFHTQGGAPDPPLPSGMLYWGYNGRAPVSRMINARVMAAPIEYSNGVEYFDPAPKNWVGGCGGAVGFSAEVLRAVNIPVERTIFGHQQNRYSIGSGQIVSTAHADDPYGLRQMPEIPIGDILLDEATFEEWFLNEDDPAIHDKNSARRAADLYYQYLPNALLARHCSDLAFGNSHEESDVMGYFQLAYTVAEMEAKGLWPAMEAKIPTVGNCAAFGIPWIVLP
jgi:hypothetical protein